MESSDLSNHSKRSPRGNSKSHISMSDTESITSQVDSFHSPLRSESPLRSDDHLFPTENDDSSENNCWSIVLVDKYASPATSPGKTNFPASSPASVGNSRRPWPQPKKPSSENLDFPESPAGEGVKDGARSHRQPMAPGNLDFPSKGAATSMVVSKLLREDPSSEVKNAGPVDAGGSGGGGGSGEGHVGDRDDEVGGERRSRTAVESILKRRKRNVAVKKVALGFRVFEVVTCLVSFSVMAADRTQGWSGDSFDRYIEYRYCLAVNVIGFVYSGFQAFDLAYYLTTGKRVVAHYLRRHFDFAIDQILAYLVMSASSSAATRVDDWISNWGGDEFTLMVSSSVAVSFLAFIAFALSSLVSGYALCNRDST
ncbi:hypothetical protein OROGR_011447 [Orobanche gracilis]